MATRILAHLGLLAPGGRIAMIVGSDVVYLAGRDARADTLTPYDVAAVHLADGLELAGSPPDDVAAYLGALRSRGARVAALVAGGELVTGADLIELVERVARVGWTEAEARVRSAGGLIGVYPAGSQD